jgi:hypothetical protein
MIDLCEEGVCVLPILDAPYEKVREMIEGYCRSLGVGATGPPSLSHHIRQSVYAQLFSEWQRLFPDLSLEMLLVRFEWSSGIEM